MIKLYEIEKQENELKRSVQRGTISRSFLKLELSMIFQTITFAEHSEHR
jgi:hypothetical protein